MQHCLWLCTSEVRALCPSSGDSWERPSLYINNTRDFSLSLLSLCLCPLLIFHWILLMRVWGLALWLRLPSFGVCFGVHLCVWMYVCACVPMYSEFTCAMCVSICAHMLLTRLKQLLGFYTCCCSKALWQCISPCLTQLHCSLSTHDITICRPFFLHTHFFLFPPCFHSFSQLRHFANYRLGILGRAVHPVGSSQFCAFVLLPLHA